MTPQTSLCAATGKHPASGALVHLQSIRPNVADTILKQFPHLKDHSWVSKEIVNSARLEYVRSLLTGQLGELTELDEEVIESLRDHEIVSEVPEEAEEDSKATFGERLSDRIATFGGSWTFILSFMAFMATWIVFNVYIFSSKSLDPYPFILLNLILSCLAALQAPILMMSQRRQEVRDRHRAESDYKVNLKAELEIRHLHEKIDYILHQQVTRLMEVQQIQSEAMQEAGENRESPSR